MSGTDPPVSLLDDRALLRVFLDEKKNQQAAWAEFLRRHSPLLLKTAWQFADNHDGAMTMYLFVCERLSADDFAKLCAYNSE